MYKYLILFIPHAGLMGDYLKCQKGNLCVEVLLESYMITMASSHMPVTTISSYNNCEVRNV